MARSNAINLNESRVISWIHVFDYHFDSFDYIYVIIVTILMIMFLKMGSFSVGSIWISDFGTWIFGLGKLNVVFAKLRLALELFCVDIRNGICSWKSDYSGLGVLHWEKMSCER